MMNEYWPWWIGAVALSGASLSYLLFNGHMLGVSGSWTKVVNWKDNRANEKAAVQLSANQDEVNDVLMAETLAEFGPEAVAKLLADTSQLSTESVNLENVPIETPWSVHLTFLLSLFLGSLVTASLNDQIDIRFDLSDIHTQIFGELWEVWLALLFGGIMVGFGTQMAGGCTSGHGLSGCARLIPGSLLATASFMFAGIVLSMLMEVMI